MDLHPEVMVKATPLKSVVTFIDKNLNTASQDRVYDAVAVDFPELSRRVRSRLFITSDKVPVMFVNRLIEAAATELGQQPAALAHRIGRSGAEEAAGGMLRLALAVISVPNLLVKLGPIWGQINTHGTMSHRVDKNSAVLELTGYPVVSATGCGRITGFLEWFAQRAEKTATLVHSECRAAGASVCRWTVQW